MDLMDDMDGRKKSGGVKWLAYGFAAILAIFALLVVVTRLWVQSQVDAANLNIEAHLAKIRAAGEPVTLQELAASVPSPRDEDNAAIVLKQAFDAFSDVTDSDSPVPYMGSSELLSPSEPLSDEMRAAGNQLLETNAKCLILTGIALERKSCRFPIDYENASSVHEKLPHLTKIRELARLLALKALIEAENKHGDASCVTLVELTRLAEQLRAEPIFISQTVRTMVRMYVFLALEQTLNRAESDPEPLLELQNALALAVDPEMTYRTLVGERCQGIYWVEHPGNRLSNVSTRSLRDLIGSLPSVLAGNPIDEDAYLTLMDTFITASKLPFPDMLDRFDEISTNLKGGHGFGMKSLLSLFTEIIEPMLTRLCEVHAKDTAEITICVAAVAIERFKAVEHRLPRAIDELVPAYIAEVPKDPFDGKPIRYRHDERGFTVYSIGMDRKDDGGREAENSTQRWMQNDLTFTVKTQTEAEGS